MLRGMITEPLANPDCFMLPDQTTGTWGDSLWTGLVPLVVGVAGHRDLDARDKDATLARVGEALADFEKRWPHSPRVLICGLAEGADQWVCESALNRGWQVVAGLAAPAAEFIADFSSDEVREQFESLIARCLSVQVICPNGTPSPQRYQEVGQWICRQSQWLIGLWDGHPATADQPGGTAWVIERFLRGEVGPDLQFPDCGPVTHIRVRRRGHDEGSTSVRPPAAVQANRTLWPDANSLEGMATGSGKALKARTAQQHWQSILTRIDEFNRLARTHSRRHPQAMLTPVERLGSTVSRATRQPGGNPVLSRAVALHAVADQLALRAQSAERWRLGGIVLCALLAAVLAELYSGPLQSAHWLALGLAALSVALGLTWWPRLPGRRHSLLHDAQALYQDCRGLAEACRVQAYWACAGLEDAVADHYLPDQRDELEWLRQALRNLHLIRSETRVSGARQPAGRCAAPLTELDPQTIQAVRSDWIVGQQQWHGKSAASQSRIARRLQATVVISLAASLLAVIAALVMEASAHPESGPAWLQFVWGTALSLAAAAGSIRVVLGYRENVRNYTRMRLTEELARRELDRLLAHTPLDLKACQRVIGALGRAALDENGEWLLLHRDRPAGPPL
jgi:hypothetical protein